VDNQSFAILCSPARDEAGEYVAFGHSLICDPWGKIVGELDEKEGVLVCDLDLSKIQNMRTSIPTGKQRRHDLFSIAEKKE
jgi:predicted amidohydrolase